MKKHGGALVAAIVLLCAVGSPMLARSQPAAPIDSNPFLVLLPALRTAPAPGWVTPGTRMTYESAAAAAPGYLNCHEETPGRWQDDQGGECGGLGRGTRGLTQITVVALDQQVAVLDLQIYTLTNGTGPAVTSGFMGAVGVPGAGVDWWLNPQVLRGAVGLSAPGLKVLQMRYPMGGREYNAIRFQTREQTASRAWVYDADTGVLLHTASAQAAGYGETVLTQNTLLGVRVPRVPWALIAAPDWVNRTNVLHYQGRTTFYVPGAAPASVPASVTFQRQSGGPNWVRYLQKTIQATPPGMPSPPTENVRITGSAQFGGLWIPPRGLSQLRPGQTLDADPITGTTTSVSQVGRTQQGAMAVTITEANQGQRVDSVYDMATGALLYVSVMDNILHARVEFQLVGRQ